MKNILSFFSLLLFLSSCSKQDKQIVNSSFADSLITNYTASQLASVTDTNLRFWKKRMDSLPDNFVNGPEYASALSAHFHLSGEISEKMRYLLYVMHPILNLSVPAVFAV